MPYLRIGSKTPAATGSKLAGRNYLLCDQMLVAYHGLTGKETAVNNSGRCNLFNFKEKSFNERKLESRLSNKRQLLRNISIRIKKLSLILGVGTPRAIGKLPGGKEAMRKRERRPAKEKRRKK